MGRKPKPTALKVFEGNRGRRKPNTREPKPTQKTPACPAWLDAEAKAEWKRVVPELARMKMLTVVDRAGLTAYCEACSLMKRCSLTLQEEGLTCIGSTGGTIRHPASAIIMTAMATVKHFCSLFGLSPADRSKMSVPEPEAKGEDADTDGRLLG